MITDELREYVARHEAPCLSMSMAAYLRGIADRIDSEHRAALEKLAAAADEDRDGWVELPRDADGEHIHIGDVMVYADGNTCPLPVVALVPPAVFLTDEGPRYADMCRHQPDTWESIIEDALGSRWSEPDKLSSEFIALVARCKALCERTKEVGE